MSVVSVHPVLPRDANPSGAMNGGALMALADRIASVAAVRHSHGRAVTASVEGMRFPSPARVGDVLTVTAEVVDCGTSSMEVAVRVEAETYDPADPVRLVLEGSLRLVAVDDDGRARPVPNLDVGAGDGAQPAQ